MTKPDCFMDNYLSLYYYEGADGRKCLNVARGQSYISNRIDSNIKKFANKSKKAKQTTKYLWTKTAKKILEIQCVNPKLLWDGVKLDKLLFYSLECINIPAFTNFKILTPEEIKYKLECDYDPVHPLFSDKSTPEEIREAFKTTISSLLRVK